MARLYGSPGLHLKERFLLLLILMVAASFTVFTLFIWIFEPMIYEPFPSALIVSTGVFILGFSMSWSAYKGYIGEREVGRELSKLPDDYAVFFNVPLGGLDADVVVVGPTGVYVLEVKNWSNRVLTPRKGRWIRIPKRWVFLRTGIRGVLTYETGCKSGYEN